MDTGENKGDRLIDLLNDQVKKDELPKSEPAQPEVPEAKPAQTEPAQPAATQPKPAQPEMPEAKPAQTGPAQPAVTEPKPAQPEMPEAKPAKPEIPPLTRPLQSAAPHNEPAQPEAPQPVPSQSGPVQPDAAKPGTAQTEPVTPQPGVPQGEPAQPGAAQGEPEQPRQMRSDKKVSKHQLKKAKKAQAKEDVRELAREIKADKKMQKIQRHQQKLEEHEKYPTGPLRRKARRLRWKKEKADRRQALKDRYRDAPWIVRVPRLYLLKPFIALLIIAAVVGGAYALVQTTMPTLISSYLDTNKNNPVSQERIYSMSPIDEEGAKRIDAVAPVGKDDTWTISVYIVGSNLEDMGEDDLSDVVRNQVMEGRQQIGGEISAAYAKRLTNFTKELQKNDLDIPAYLYYPNKPVKSAGAQGDGGPVVTDEPGCASVDIGEMTADTWSDNINVVIQTGGATRWSNSMVNPNRTQRFLYHNGVFSEVDNQPLQPAASPETLTSFLDFCKKNYPADHNMLVLWNHGGGAFGYGMDSLYGNLMSLKDLRKGLEGAYKPDGKKPAFDIIGFDACLMSSLEVVHALDGFASYYAVSAETEPGDGWDYTPWLKAMTENPTMSPAKVARNIADSYMDSYMTQNANIGWLVTSDVCFSVLDASKTENLYKAWCDLTKQQLIDAATDGGVLSEIGRCSNKSTHYVSSAYNVYNTIDLGNYVDLMADTYPKECSRVKKLLGEAVMYHRESGALSDSQGMSVYLPGSVNNYEGLAYCLDYIYDICEDPSTRALYYYKIAGCLNDDMEEHLAKLTKDKARTLDLKPFQEFAKSKPVTTDDGFEIKVSENLQSMLETYNMEIAGYDEETGIITNYGRDETIRLDGEGNMDCEFDGTWICYDGVPLATEVVASTDSSVEYRSKVRYNGKDSYLSFVYDRDTDEFTINGIRGVSSAGLVSDDPVNYLINSRMNTEVKRGDEIVPLYEVSAASEQDSGKKPSQGKTIKVGKRSKITSDKLPSGYYLTSAVISDPRGDVYYSQVVGNDVSGGKVDGRRIDEGFVGRDY